MNKLKSPYAHVIHRRHLYETFSLGFYVVASHWLTEAILDGQKYGPRCVALLIFSLAGLLALHSLGPLFRTAPVGSSSAANEQWRKRLILLLLLAGIGGSLVLTTKFFISLAQGVNTGAFKIPFYYVFGFLGFCFLLYRIVKRDPGRVLDLLLNEKEVVRIKEAELSNRENLVLILSDEDNDSLDKIIESYGPNHSIQLTEKSNYKDLIAFFDEYRSDCEQQRGRPTNWRWEMPLRSIRAHLFNEIGEKKDDRHIYLILSDRSARKFTAFDVVYNQVFGEHTSRPKLLVVPEAASDLNLSICDADQVREFERRAVAGTMNADNVYRSLACDFENLKQIQSKILAIREQIKLRNSSQSADDMTIIDITSGTKTASLAAALITIGRTMLLQYIDTNTYKPCLYDLHMEPQAGL
jgi:hypothetical protein